MFAQYLHSVMTYPEIQPIETELETCYARHETEEQSVLSHQLTLFLNNISCSTRTVSSRIVPLSVAYIHLADLILIDSPLLEAADDDVWIPIGEEDIPSCTTASSRSQAPVSNDRPLPKKLPSVQDILEDNSFKEFTDTTRGMKLTALNTVDKTQLISTSTQNMEGDEQQVETLSNSNSSTGSIPLDTDTTVTSTEITWGKINQLLQPLRQHEPGFPPLTNIQHLFTAPLPDDLVADIQTLRERSHMPHTMSRILYDRWTSAKSPEACLTTHQLDTVLR